MNLQSYFKVYAESHQNVWNRRCHMIGIPLIVVSIFMLATNIYSQTWWTVFAVGWVFQFIGHGIERTVPEFMRSPVYLLIGPMYFVAKILKKTP